MSHLLVALIVAFFLAPWADPALLGSLCIEALVVVRNEWKARQQ